MATQQHQVRLQVHQLMDACLFALDPPRCSVLALVASVGWQDWSVYGQPSVTVQDSGGISFEVDQNFKDTWHGSIGAQYRIADAWLWSVGFAYDSSPLADDDNYSTNEDTPLNIAAAWT